MSPHARAAAWPPFGARGSATKLPDERRRHRRRGHGHGRRAQPVARRLRHPRPRHPSRGPRGSCASRRGVSPLRGDACAGMRRRRGAGRRQHADRGRAVRRRRRRAQRRPSRSCCLARRLRRTTPRRSPDDWQDAGVDSDRRARIRRTAAGCRRHDDDDAVGPGGCDRALQCVAARDRGQGVRRRHAPRRRGEVQDRQQHAGRGQPRGGWRSDRARRARRPRSASRSRRHCGKLRSVVDLRRSDPARARRGLRAARGNAYPVQGRRSCRRSRGPPASRCDDGEVRAASFRAAVDAGFGEQDDASIVEWNRTRKVPCQ